MHDPRSVPPPPLVPRHLCLGVTERVDYNGNVLIPLDEAEVETVARQLRAAGVQSVAVCFLHSYTNPDHEQRARQLISAVMPDASVVISREVLPEIKFYERLSTTVFTAMLAPILDRYLEQLQAELQGVGFTGAFLLMQAKRRNDRTGNSGPESRPKPRIWACWWRQGRLVVRRLTSCTKCHFPGYGRHQL